MIGRGTCSSPDLHGIGQDKTYFLIFDYCGNFEFFRENPKRMETIIGKILTEKLFNTKVDIFRKLQGIQYQTEEYSCHRSHLVDGVTKDILALDEENFRFKQHLQYVEKFKDKNNWMVLYVLDTNEIKEHISPICQTVRFINLYDKTG